MKKNGILILLIMLVAVGTVYARERTTRDERRQQQSEKVQRLVDAQDYKFVAQQTTPVMSRELASFVTQHTAPASWELFNLTSGFFLNVSNDTITAHLPFFGRAFVAPANPAESGIRFESTDFSYRLEAGRRGGWIAHIAIYDATRRIDLVLDIATSGTATLSVNDNMRQPILFNGYITERR
jgi:hypothetical protein